MKFHAIKTPKNDYQHGAPEPSGRNIHKACLRLTQHLKIKGEAYVKTVLRKI
jgi:hypothetical protein